MKYLFISTLLFLCGCEEIVGKYPNTPDGRRQVVVDEMQTNEVAPIPDTSDRFFARTKDGTVWFVQVHNQKIYNKQPLLIERVIQTNM